MLDNCLSEIRHHWSTPRIEFPRISACRHDQFVCGSGMCLDQSKACDSVDDCGDGSDEGQICGKITIVLNWCKRCPPQ